MSMTDQQDEERMSRSAPVSPFRDPDQDYDPIPRPRSELHSTSILLPIKSQSGGHSSPLVRQETSPASFSTQSSAPLVTSSYSAPNSPSSGRRILFSAPVNIRDLPVQSLVLNHPQLQRLREEACGTRQSSHQQANTSHNNNNRQARISAICSLSLTPGSRNQGFIDNGLTVRNSTSSSPSPFLIQEFRSGPRSRSFSQSFPAFDSGYSSSSTSSFSRPIRSSTICVSFSPGSAPSSGSITVRRTRTDPVGSFRLTATTTRSRPSNFPSNLSSNTNQSTPQGQDMNRQQSAPAAHSRPGIRIGDDEDNDNSRSLSIDVPPRPASASPTVMPRMRLVPIMQPIEATLNSDQEETSDPYLRPSQQQPHRPAPQTAVFSSSVSRGDYMESLLMHQQKRLDDLKEQSHRLKYNVDVKKANIRLREIDLFKRLLEQPSNPGSVAGGGRRPLDFFSSRDLDSLIQTLEEVRGLKVEIICLVAEIDGYGDHFLGDLDLRKVVQSRTPVAAPPVPPRPPANSKNQKVNQKPNFCILEMRVPTSVSCAAGSTAGNPGHSPNMRRSSNQSNNTLTPSPGMEGGMQFLRSSSHGYASMNSPGGDDHGNNSSLAVEEEEEWLCTSCTFSNHPRLLSCEMCEKPKSGYPVPASAGPPGPASSSPTTMHQHHNNNHHPSPSGNMRCACDNRSTDCSSAASTTSPTDARHVNVTNMILTNSAVPSHDEPVVNFVYLTHDLMNRPFVLIPVSLNRLTSETSPLTHNLFSSLSINPSADESTSILSALSSLSDQLNLLLLPTHGNNNNNQNLNLAFAHSVPPVDANANLRLNARLAGDLHPNALLSPNGNNNHENNNPISDASSPDEDQT